MSTASTAISGISNIGFIGFFIFMLSYGHRPAPAQLKSRRSNPGIGTRLELIKPSR